MDTGVGLGHPGIDEAFAPVVHHDLEERLGSVGVKLVDVIMVINTHLHFDHCGNNSLFPGVPLVAQRREYEDAQTSGYTIPEWVDFPGAEWSLVEGEAEVLSGLAVVPTPGHTLGHQSVVVSIGEGVEVIAGQTLYDPDELESEESIEPLTESEAQFTTESARWIKALNPRRVLFSHDSRIWQPTGPGIPSST